MPKNTLDKESRLRTLLEQLASKAYLMGFSHCQGVEVDGVKFNEPNAENIYTEEALKTLKSLITDEKAKSYKKGLEDAKV